MNNTISKKSMIRLIGELKSSGDVELETSLEWLFSCSFVSDIHLAQTHGIQNERNLSLLSLF